jgi:septal ring factor EnvC (AmiA/AmiB activator)
MVLLSLILAATAVQAQRVTPVEKVITLLTNLVTEVQAEGKTEATNYDEYACFCKKTTEEKSDSITTGRDAIDTLSAAIADDTATKAEKTTELGERKTKHEELQKELAETTTRLAKEKAEYEAEAADLSKAIASLEGAIDSLENTKPVLLEVRKAVQVSLALADGMNMITEQKRKAISAFLQTSVDPSDPTYKYHSQGIIDMLNQLHTEFPMRRCSWTPSGRRRRRPLRTRFRTSTLRSLPTTVP